MVQGDSNSTQIKQIFYDLLRSDPFLIIIILIIRVLLRFRDYFNLEISSKIISVWLPQKP
jgi:hypothetical protein